ncbi:carboxypeptidase-like regulatory domain-containing protein [Ekhidna sp.]
MKYLVIILGVLATFSSLAQTNIAILGNIKSGKTNEALSFATIGILGSPHGTISNTDGEFAFFIPESYSADTLTVSYVGFENYKVAINSITDRNNVQIVLEEHIIMLEEVEVNGDQLTATQIMQKAIDKVVDNFSSNPYIIQGFFRDIRDQNGETVYLTEASVNIKDPGYSKTSSRPKKFFLKGVRASDSRINKLLSRSLLNAGNALNVNLEQNYWLNRLRHDIRTNDYEIDEIIYKNDRILYSIITEETSSKVGSDERYKDLTFSLTHRYLVDSESFAISKVEHIERATDGKYVGIEPPYEGDTLFYCKKGWNQIIEFEEFEGKMFLKYHDVNYAFDIVDQKNEEVYLDMSYQFTFITTDVITDETIAPEGFKMNKNKPLAHQAKAYDAGFWGDPSNAKLVPLTNTQIEDLQRIRPLEKQFRSAKK